jgi:hypothetical protein
MAAHKGSRSLRKASLAAATTVGEKPAWRTASKGQLRFAAALKHVARIYPEDVPQCNRTFRKRTRSDGQLHQFTGWHLPQPMTRHLQRRVKLGSGEEVVSGPAFGRARHPCNYSSGDRPFIADSCATGFAGKSRTHLGHDIKVSDADVLEGAYSASAPQPIRRVPEQGRPISSARRRLAAL